MGHSAILELVIVTWSNRVSRFPGPGSRASRGGIIRSSPPTQQGASTKEERGFYKQKIGYRLGGVNAGLTKLLTTGDSEKIGRARKEALFERAAGTLAGVSLLVGALSSKPKGHMVSTHA